MDIKQYLEKNKRSSLAQPKKNFTLVELAVVITTIGTLAAIVIPNATNKVADARVSALKQDIAHIEQALMQHEIENPEVPVLSKVEASELGSKLKSTVEKELNDDASDVYRIDMKVLKDYLHKTKYGHLDDDAKEDEYFFSKKTNRVYYEKGYSTSKGYRVHYLGSGNAKMQSAIKQLSPVKIITTLPVTYYLLENGDLYAEGYNYFGMMMKKEDLMFKGSYSGAKRLPLQKIASDVAELKVSGVYDTSNSDVSGLAYKKTNGDWVLMNAYQEMNDDYVTFSDFFKTKTLSGVEDIRIVSDYRIAVLMQSGVVDLYDEQGNLHSTINDVKGFVGNGNLLELTDGTFLNFENNWTGEDVTGRMESSDPNKGLPFQFEKSLPSGTPLFKAGSSYYVANPGNTARPIQTAVSNLYDGSDRGYIYKDDSKNLYSMYNGNLEMLADGVDGAFYWDNSNVVYKKGEDLFVYNLFSKESRDFFQYASAPKKVKSFVVKKDTLAGDTTFVFLDDKDTLYTGDIYGETVELAKDVDSYKFADVTRRHDSLIVKTKDGKTHRVLVKSNEYEERFTLKKDTEIMDEK